MKKILKTNNSENNLISVRAMDVKFLSDRTSVSWAKQEIMDAPTEEARLKLEVEFLKRQEKAYTQKEYSRQILQPKRRC